MVVDAPTEFAFDGAVTPEAATAAWTWMVRDLAPDLIEATQDAVIFIDKQACIVIFNPAAERIFGYSRDEALGQKVNLLMAEPYAAEHDQYIERYEKTGEKRAIGRSNP